MAVAYDTVGPTSGGASSNFSTALSWSHTCTGTELCLIVGVALNNNTAGSGETMTATYNGVSMTSIGSIPANNQNAGYVQMWRLVAPATGANTVAITASGATPQSLVGGSVSFTGVNQTTPCGTPATGFGATGTATVNVAGTTAGNMVVDAVCNGASVTSSNQTQRWLKNDNTFAAAGNAAQSTAAAGGTVTMSYAVTADWYGIIAVEVLASGAAPSTPLQPVKVLDRGTVANATAATTSAVTLSSPTTIAVGNYLIARVAVDNSGTNGAAPGCTVTDPRSNTWTVLGPALVDPGVAAAGATAYLCYAKVVTAYQAADALTFNWGGISTTAKAVVVEEWANLHRTTPVAVAPVTNTGTASTTVQVSITPTTPNQLVYASLAVEGVIADTFTSDTDTTSGTWVDLTWVASANATRTNNQLVEGQYKVVTAAGAQSWDATITSADWAAIAVVFAVDEPPPPRVFVRPGLAATQGGSW